MPQSQALASPSHGAEALAVERPFTGSSEEALGRFADPRLLAEGKIALVSVEAIMTGFGKKWAWRSDQVHEHVQRTFERDIGPHGFFLKVSETDYLICQPEVSRFSGQAACLRTLREILSHFLGSAHFANVGVLEVRKLSPKAIEAHAIDATSVTAAAEQEAERVVSLPRPSGSVGIWSPFVAADGRPLHVSCRLEPVFELKGYSRIGMRLKREVARQVDGKPLSATELRALARSDLIRIDFATIAHGISRLRAAGDRRHPTLLVPVSFASLSSHGGRAQLLSAIKDAAGLVQAGLICELTDVEGAPQCALLPAVNVMRPLARYVLGGLADPSPSAVAALKGAGFHGVCFDLPLGPADSERALKTKATIDAARRLVRSVIVCGAASTREMATIALSGATHGSIRAAED